METLFDSSGIPSPMLPAGIPLPSAASGVLLESWMDDQASAICRGEWAGWPSSGALNLLRDAVRAAGADEGVLWLVDDLRGELRPCFSIGSHSEIFLSEIRQPLSSGLISMVFFTENAICESEVGRHAEYCPDVDLRIGTKTKAMVAIPVFFAQRCRGVFSAVLFDSSNGDAKRDAFAHGDFEILSKAAAIWSELMDSQLAGGVLQQIGNAWT